MSTLTHYPPKNTVLNLPTDKIRASFTYNCQKNTTAWENGLLCMTTLENFPSFSTIATCRNNFLYREQIFHQRGELFNQQPLGKAEFIWWTMMNREGLQNLSSISAWEKSYNIGFMLLFMDEFDVSPYFDYHNLWENQWLIYYGT